MEEILAYRCFNWCATTLRIASQPHHINSAARLFVQPPHLSPTSSSKFHPGGREIRMVSLLVVIPPLTHVSAGSPFLVSRPDTAHLVRTQLKTTAWCHEIREVPGLVAQSSLDCFDTLTLHITQSRCLTRTRDNFLGLIPRCLDHIILQLTSPTRFTNLRRH